MSRPIAATRRGNITRMIRQTTQWEAHILRYVISRHIYLKKYRADWTLLLPLHRGAKFSCESRRRWVATSRRWQTTSQLTRRRVELNVIGHGWVTLNGNETSDPSAERRMLQVKPAGHRVKQRRYCVS